MKKSMDELTVGEVRELMAMFGTASQPGPSHPYNIGANYFLRTVTHHHTGRLVQVTSQELILEDAAWIADDGRFTDALKKCEFSEVEMFPEGRVIIGRGSLIDATEISNIPKSQK